VDKNKKINESIGCGFDKRGTEREKVVKTTRSHRKKISGKQPKKRGEWKGARLLD